MPALTLSPGLVVRLVVVYAVGVAMLVVGVRHTYWAWTGQTDELTTVVEGPLAEEPGTRRYLWMVGAPARDAREPGADGRAHLAAGRSVGPPVTVPPV